ncbi:unnamed protein product [Bursaphelenchus xylophilus]|uniref:(pine wood nematode) hypothetical protein n=1 Tax=Bursaphelenchus xylophilus TaxID=6326 RepID=A0A1I7SA12_BURXY|nr:unnamed protein product [Bursaphelenchus xylophilus]CAG9126070.1 unnamed protein product [Bursaphelenchus xylophilus]
MSKDSDPSTITPPSYSVVENRDGQLVNASLKVVWPKRPARGRHSIHGYMRRRNKAKAERPKSQVRKAAEIKSESDWTFSGDEDESEINIPIAPEVASKFIGIQRASRTASFLRPTQLVLYYRRPEACHRITDIPLSYPLMCAYMSSGGKIYHYDIKKTRNRDGMKMWQVRSKEKDLPEQPAFCSLDALLRYYQTYTIMFRDNGQVESFPVPR